MFIDAIRNALTFVRGDGFIRTGFRIEGGLFTEIEDGEGYTLPVGTMVLPGFIDIHIHGVMGSDVTDASADGLKKIAGALAAEGTTSFLPTVMTQERSVMLASVRSVREFIENYETDRAEAIGIHLEGPFLSEKYAGGQPRYFVNGGIEDHFRLLEKEGGGNIKILTLAPEITGIDFIRETAAENINVSIGHSDASFETVMKSVGAGAKGVTHTFNAQRGFHHREAGVVGAALLCEDVWCELIADGCHVSVPAMRLLVKNKRADKVILITDSIRVKGMGAKDYTEGGLSVHFSDGEARLQDGTLAGSILKMNVALRNMVQKVKVPVETAVKFCTENPARYLNEDRLGVIDRGKQADFVVVDQDFNVLLTVKKGKVIYNAGIALER